MNKSNVYQAITFFLMIISLGVTACSKKQDIKVDEKPERERATYYIDAASGNDSNEGTSRNNAWKTLLRVNSTEFKPGDSILFKTGCSWEGQLVLNGTGADRQPVVVSAYGDGNKPVIDGKGKVDQIILLEKGDFWEISNLEITNNATTTGNRTGVMIRSTAAGAKRHFHLKNLYIHDIMGDYSFEMKGKNTGGIGIIGGPDTKFENILIEDCEIGNINRVGIFTNLTDAKKATRGNRPISNLVIRRNKIHHCAGDGAIIRYAYKPIIEYNTVYDNHTGDEELVKHGVALWCRSTDEALFQYNEVYNTRGSMDGQAFDADLDAWRTVVQYNYSHGNEGGFMLVYGSSSDAIVRYNLSVNDGAKGGHIFDFPVWTNPRGSGIFHNNTIVINEGSATVIADEALETAKFHNNIFYNRGSGALVMKSEGKTAVFVNNSYVGYTKDDIADISAILSDPLLINPIGGKGLGSTEGFKVQPESPCMNKGINKSAMQGNYWLPDLGSINFWREPLSGFFNIGAQ